MASYSFTINKQLANLNDYLQKERLRIRTRNGKFTTAGNTLKHQTQEYIIKCIRRDLGNLHIKKQVDVYFCFYEPNMKRDKDNILSFASKCTLDSLVISKVIENDGWHNINKLSADFRVDKDNPRIVCVLTEVE